MSRSGYIDDGDMEQWDFIRWRGAVTSAIRGKRGQKFLREALKAIDALPAPHLIAGDLERDGDVCLLGAVGKKRGLDMKEIDPEDYESVAGALGIPETLARELMYENDEGGRGSPYKRYERMRKWVIGNLKSDL